MGSIGLMGFMGLIVGTFGILGSPLGFFRKCQAIFTSKRTTHFTAVGAGEDEEICGGGGVELLTGRNQARMAITSASKEMTIESQTDQ
jgi:hypothetical protein